MNIAERRSLIADAAQRRRDERMERESAKYEEWLIKEATRRRVAAELTEQSGDEDE